MVEHGEIRVVHRGGSKINFRQPVFTHDSRFLLCASANAVKVFSASTEECVHHLVGHTDLVTGLILRPSNHLQVFSCSLDGTVRLWDYDDGILIKTFVVGFPIYSIYASGSHDGVLFLTIPAKNDKRSDAFQLVAVQLPQSSEQLVEAREISAVLPDVSANPGAISFGRAGQYIASVCGLHLEVFFFKKQKSFRFSLKEENNKGIKNTFTCAACHPKEDCIATGHEDGKIRLWRNFSHKKEYTHSALHWHHDAVGALSFTPEGTNLLSGGVESVLVLWRYNQETQKDFLPRLGAAIAHIAVSPDGSLFCTAHSDNKITVIHSYVRVSAVIQGLVRGDRIWTDLVVDPRSKALVMNGKPGHLQFYSLQRDKLLYNLDIVQQEYIHESGLDQFEVVKVDFDAGGNWLATVEERKQNSAELELNLKLWAFDEQTQSFVLNTTVPAPHEDRISDLSFSPDRTTLLVSASRDGHFKAWALAPPTDAEDQSPSWCCDFVASYHGLAPHCCGFSADGSLLAVGFQEVVTVWSTASWELLTTLSQPPGHVRNLCFGRLSCSKYLLGTTTKNQLCCWNLLSCSLEWSTSMDVTLLLADPLSENMAAFCFEAGSTDLFVFKPSEPRPLFSHKAVCSGRVLRAVFSPREELLEGCEEDVQWLNSSRLFFFTPSMDLMTFSTKAEEDRLMASSKQLVIGDQVSMTPFNLLLGKRGQTEGQEVAAGSERVQPPQGSSAVKELLQTPAHVLPSTSYLCSMFVQSLLISTSDKREQNNVTEEEMESEKEEDDSEDEETQSSAVKPDVASGGGRTGDPTRPHGLTKAQTKELRRVRKLDYSWLRDLD
uniref:WD repeat-containing protein 75 second beta-propeller domain-containing protein n=1 Tax=Periophthalmus magnuspinnatus TaxID=409849 RepID=A0A3B3Z852_9GOBI